MCQTVPHDRGGLGPGQTVAGLAAVVALAMLLRIIFLGKQSLWWDEISTVRIVGGDWGHLLRTLWYGDAEMHPQGNMSFYYALLHVWVGAGRGEFVLRLFSVLVSGATVPIVYLLGAELLGPRAGLLASLLLALNAVHIQYAQEVRSYALLVLLVTVSSWYFVRGIRRPSWTAWAWYTAASALAVYAHFFAALVLVAQWIVLALRGRAVPWRFVMVSVCSIGVLLLPAVVFVLKKDTGQVSWIPRPGPDAVPAALAYLAGAGSMWNTAMPGPLLAAAEAGRYLLLLLYAALILSALLYAGRRRGGETTSLEPWAYAFLLAWLLVPPIVAYLVSLVKPVFMFYYLIVSLPPLILLAADGLSRIRPRPLFAVALAVLVGASMLQAAMYYGFYRKTGGARPGTSSARPSLETVPCFRCSGPARRPPSSIIGTRRLSRAPPRP